MRKTLSGQSMIEVVVGLAVATLLAVALISTTLYTQKLSRSAKNNTQASKLAQQAIEQVRVVRDRQGFAALTNNAPGSCYRVDTVDPNNPSTWVLTASGCPYAVPLAVTGETAFTRTIVITDGNFPANEKKVTVTVSWTEGATPMTVTNITFLSRTCIGAVSTCT